MLPKVNRLKKNKEFERVFKKGQSFREDFLILRVAPNNLKNSRFGLIVSSKVSKKAVLRNKIKRRLRTAILLKLKEINKKQKAIDAVIIIKPGTNIKDFQEIGEAINKLFKKAKIARE